MLTLTELLSSILISFNQNIPEAEKLKTRLTLNVDQLQDGRISLIFSDGIDPEKLINDALKRHSDIHYQSSENTLTINVPLQKDKLEKVYVPSIISGLEELASFFSIQIVVQYQEKDYLLNKGVFPLWRKDSSNTTNEDYINFYQKMYQEEYESEDDCPPWVYVKTYEPFQVEGILFFEKFNPYKVIGPSKKVSLLIEGGTVTDPGVMDVLPDIYKDCFGVVEIKELPYLDKDELRNTINLKALTEELVLNVAYSLRRLFLKNRVQYEQLWPYFSNFIKKSCLNNQEFDQVLRPCILYKTISGQLQTLDEMLKNEDRRKPQAIYYYDKNCVNPEVLSFTTRGIKEKALKCIEIDGFLDPLFMQFEETSVSPGRFLVSFISIEEVLSELGAINDELSMSFEELFKKSTSGFLTKEDHEVRGNLKIVVKDFEEGAPELFLHINETSRRAFYNTRFTVGIESWPIDMSAVFNSKHPKVQKAMKLNDDEKEDYLALMYTKALRYIWPQVPTPSLKSELK